METSLPKCVRKYFWGDNLSQLNWQKHQKYIIQTILNKGDVKAINWLLQKVDKKELKKQLPSFHLDPKSKNFWKLYLE